MAMKAKSVGSNRHPSLLVFLQHALLVAILTGTLFSVHHGTWRHVPLNGRHLAQVEEEPMEEFPHAEATMHLNLRRPRQVIQLEQRVHADPLLGVCHQGTPLLDGVPEHVCADLLCLWSPSSQQNIDLWINLLVPLQHGAVRSGRCPPPRGGQTAQPWQLQEQELDQGGVAGEEGGRDQRPLVSVALLLHMTLEVGWGMGD
jgi:hypothetical protein